MTSPVKELVAEVIRAQLPPPRVRRQIRERARVTVREAAKACQVTPLSFMRWESGAVVPKRAHAIRYRELLDSLEQASR